MFSPVSPPRRTSPMPRKGQTLTAQRWLEPAGVRAGEFVGDADLLNNPVNRCFFSCFFFFFSSFFPADTPSNRANLPTEPPPQTTLFVRAANVDDLGDFSGPASERRALFDVRRPLNVSKFGIEQIDRPGDRPTASDLADLAERPARACWRAAVANRDPDQ